MFLSTVFSITSLHTNRVSRKCPNPAWSRNRSTIEIKTHCQHLNQEESELCLCARIFLQQLVSVSASMSVLWFECVAHVVWGLFCVCAFSSKAALVPDPLSGKRQEITTRQQNE
jgi:hypothetical protein